MIKELKIEFKGFITGKGKGTEGAARLFENF